MSSFFKHPPSRLYNAVQRTATRLHLQFPVQDFPQPQCRMIEHALLASASHVQYGDQIPHHPFACPIHCDQVFFDTLTWLDSSKSLSEAVLSLHAKTEWFGWAESSQRFLYTWEKTVTGFTDSGQTTPLTIHDYNKAFQSFHMHKLNTVKLWVICKSHQHLSKIPRASPICPCSVLAPSKELLSRVKSGNCMN